MGAQVNGKPVQANGVPNGKPNVQPNGHLTSSRPKQQMPKQKASFPIRILSLFTRLLVWYTIATAVFRCPSSRKNLTDESPRVCKPYLMAISQISPHIQPYYENYVAPYAEGARPYVERMDRHIYKPVTAFGKQSYTRFGAPRVEEARRYGEAQWERLLKPQLEVVRVYASKQYSSSLAPLVEKTSATAGPYYNAGHKTVRKIYNVQVLPAYTASKPYAEKAIAVAQKAVVETGYPYAKWVWGSTLLFTQRSIWPRLQILYGENVEPQLMRISERLGRYRDGRRIKSAVDEGERVDESTTIASPITSAISNTVIAQSSSESVSVMNAKVAAPPAISSETSEEEVAAKAHAIIENDLVKWRRSWTKAAKRGTEDLKERVEGISHRQMKTQVEGVGEALVTQLEEITKSETAKLKRKISSIVKVLVDNPSGQDAQKAQDEVAKATRNAGLAIRANAQALRAWKSTFDQETYSLVDAAAKSTLEVIDSIRDLGLQEIGMRWANLEGVTYKDWARYHEVKKALAEWRKEVEAAAFEHRDFISAKAAAGDVEARGMAIAEDAAKEISRLKEVSAWKIEAGDDSDDFSTRTMPAKVAAAKERVVEGLNAASERIVGTSQDVVESLVSVATEQLTNAQSVVSSRIVGSESNVVERIATRLSETVIASPGSAYNSVRSVVDENIAAASKQASEAVLGHSTPSIVSVVSVVSGQADGAISRASEVVIGSSVPMFDSVASTASGSAKTAASEMGAAASSTILHASESVVSAASGIFAGAMAQRVEERVIVLDQEPDDDDQGSFVEQLHFFLEEAGNKYAVVTKAVSEALLKPTVTQASGKSFPSLASERYSSALAAASSVLYPRDPTTGEMVADAVSNRYSEAVAAASSVFFGTSTPTPITESLTAQARLRYAEAVNAVEEQYQRALSIASSQISGTRLPVHEKILASITSGYSGSLEAASKRLDSALRAASTGVYGTTLSPQQSLLAVANDRYSQAVLAASSQYDSLKSVIGATPTPASESILSDARRRYSDLVSGASAQYASATSAANSVIYGPSQGVLDSISAIASSRLADSLSLASAQYESVKTAVGATPTPAHVRATAEAQRRYYEGIGLAHERYSQFVTAASKAVYGTPTPLHQSIYHAASQAVHGTSVPAYQSLLDAAQSQYSNAASVASSNLDVLLSSASSRVGNTVKTPAQNLLDSASSQYSSALSVASASLAAASVAASTAVFGTPTGNVESIASVGSQKVAAISAAVSSAVIGSETPLVESIASQASLNWEDMVSKASKQIYGQPTPFAESVYAQVGVYASQATDSAVAQFAAIQALFSEVVKGKEPDFTESVMNRLSSAYYTGYPSAVSSASSYASAAYGSVSSVISASFTPPASLEVILENASEQVNAAVDAVSQQIYGTTKGTYEQMTSAAASSYASVQSQVGEAIYGSRTGYAEAAQSSIQAAAASAQSAISAAIYGTPIGTVESVTRAAADTYSTASSALDEKLSAASSFMDDSYSIVQARVSSAIHGPQQGAVESAQSRLNAAVQSARARLAGMVENTGDGVSEALKQAQRGVEDMASSVSSAVSAASGVVKDEL